MAREEDDVIGVCTECHSDQPMSYMERSPFAAEGKSVPCKYCGGVVVVTYKSNRDRSLDQSDRSRGLS